MKIKELKGYLKKNNISTCLFFNFENYTNPNFLYFTNYEGYGCLIVSKDKKPILVVPRMEAEKAIKNRDKSIKIIVYKKKFFSDLKKYSRGKNIGIDFGAVNLRLYKALRKEFKKRKFIDIADICSEIRSIKTKKEIDILRKGCKLSDKILEKCFRNFKKFKTEQQVANFLEEESRKYGCPLSFPIVIVASGKNAAQPHYVPKNTKLKKGFCVIDFGIKYNDYCTDTTRTIYLGNPSKKEIELYDLVLNCQQNTKDFIKKEKRCSKIYEKSFEELGKYAKYFTHGLGHGVGINIHELPNFKPLSKEKVKNGMVFTLEPGIYLPNKLGIRIEDTILLYNNKLEVLTKISKKLRIIK